MGYRRKVVVNKSSFWVKARQSAQTPLQSAGGTLAAIFVPSCARAIGHDILHFRARVLVAVRVAAQDAGVVLSGLCRCGAGGGLQYESRSR